MKGQRTGSGRRRIIARKLKRIKRDHKDYKHNRKRSRLTRKLTGEHARVILPFYLSPDKPTRVGNAGNITTVPEDTIALFYDVIM
jgi:hypothetical protein